MVICCSPASFNETETKSTLLFGQRYGMKTLCVLFCDCLVMFLLCDYFVLEFLSFSIVDARSVAEGLYMQI